MLIAAASVVVKSRKPTSTSLGPFGGYLGGIWEELGRYLGGIREENSGKIPEKNPGKILKIVVKVV